MPERDPKNLNFYWSTVFVRALYKNGVRDVVLSPGSRSTPLTLAFAAHPGFKKTTIIDERSAAFTALGIAKSSGVPACLVCTSGTALANYMPAVIEASQSSVPLIVASADRPPHLRGIGASQTIDQIKLFGNYPVFFHEAGEPKESNKSILRLERSASQAVRSSKEKGGVSHINFAFSKPFEPDPHFLENVELENEKHSRRSYGAYKVSIGNSSFGDNFWSDLISAEKPVIVIGPAAPGMSFDAAIQLSKILNAPILAEPASNVSASKFTITGFDGFLRNPEIASTLAPDLILRFGEEPVSKALTNYLKNNSEIMQIRFRHNSDLKDESLSAQKTVTLNGSLDIPEISGSTEKDWLKTWRKHQKEFTNFRQELLFPTSPLTDGYVFSSISSLLPKKSFSMISNSFPIRDISLFGEFDGKEIYANRGAAGIDGITSTTIGLSMNLKKTGVLFIGDIAFLHDSNALLNARYISETLIIIVLNNGGGTIFRMLPANEQKNKYSDYFETPQNVSIAALCRAHKIKHTLISRPEQLISSFEETLEKKGIHILECMTDADDSMELRKKLWNYVPAE